LLFEIFFHLIGLLPKKPTPPPSVKKTAGLFFFPRLKVFFLFIQAERERFSVALQTTKLNYQLLSRSKDACEQYSIKWGDTGVISQQYPHYEIIRVFPSTENPSQHHFGHQNMQLMLKIMICCQVLRFACCCSKT